MSTVTKDRQEEQQETEQTATETQQQENGLPKTQEELDALIAKRIARDRKARGNRQEQTPPAQQTQTETSAQQTATACPQD